ncbi:hypothetical protein KF840_09510 [bacterium]|nr:hypothetical protein [bacterium]
MRKLTAFLAGASLLASSVASAGSLAPTKPSQVVNLRFSSSDPTGPCGFGRLPGAQLMADGTAAPYEGIPAGKMLVVTAMQGYTDTALPSRLEIFKLRAPSNVAISVSCLADAFGSCHGTATFPTGIAIKSGTTLCVQSGLAATYYVTLQGFLAKDK